MKNPRKLKYFAGGKWIESKSKEYMDVYDPSTWRSSGTGSPVVLLKKWSMLLSVQRMLSLLGEIHLL